MYLRDSSIVNDLVNEGVIRAENAPMVTSIVPRLQQTYLHEAYLYGDSIDMEAQHEKFMRALDYMIATAKTSPSGS